MSLICTTYLSPVTHHPALGEPAEPHSLTHGDDSFRLVLLGESNAAQRLFAQVERIAPYLRTALVRGERGTGKALAARALHAFSRGAHGPFLRCEAISFAERLEAEGTRKGVESLLEDAGGGTLFLDSVCELPYALQAVLQQFLSEREQYAKERSGARETRILASARRDLRTLSSVGQFRPDLYARLASIEIVVPPLRERREDLGEMAAWLLDRLARRRGLPSAGISAEAIACLQARSWPGNLRELEATLTQAAMLAQGETIEPHHLPLSPVREIAETTAGLSLHQPVRSDRLQDVIECHVLDVLMRCGGNKLRAAEALGISRSTLYRMLEAREQAAQLK